MLNIKKFDNIYFYRPFVDFRKGIYGLWSIENNLHWQMDVTFREDELKAKLRYVAENLAKIRRLALSILNQENTEKKHKEKKEALLDEEKLFIEGDFRWSVVNLDAIAL